MTDQTTTTNQKIGWPRLAAGVLFSALALWIILRNVDLEQTYAAMQAMDLRYLPPALLLFIGTISVRSLAWRTILEEKISFGRAFFTENEGYFLNNVLPFRLGEVGRAVVLNLATGLSFWEVLSTIVVERIFDMAIMAGLLLSTLVFVSGAAWALNAGLLVGNQYLFPSIAAVAVGGTLLSGGKGSYFGTMAGAIVIQLITSLLTTMQLPEAIQQIVYGLILVVLLVVYGREKGLRL